MVCQPPLSGGHMLLVHNEPIHPSKGGELPFKPRIRGNHDPAENISTESVAQLVQTLGKCLAIHFFPFFLYVYSADTMPNAKKYFFYGFPGLFYDSAIVARCHFCSFCHFVLPFYTNNT